jgi:hypothetical protein
MTASFDPESQPAMIPPSSIVATEKTEHATLGIRRFKSME